jgi:hypothetical protein
MGRDPKTLTAAELADAERRMGITVSNVRTMQQLAAVLAKRYEDVLKVVQE